MYTLIIIQVIFFVTGCISETHEKYHVMYSIGDNDGYVELALMSIRSLLKNTATPENVVFHIVLTPDLFEQGIAVFSNYTSHFYTCELGSDSVYDKIHTKISFHQYLRDASSLWCRYQFISQINATKVLYIDSDTVIKADIRSLFNTYNDATVAAVRNCKIKIKDMWPTGSSDGRCSLANGVFLVDTEFWRRIRADQQIINIRRDIYNATLEDSLVFNLLFVDVYTPMDAKWNVMGLGNNRTMVNEKALEGAFLLHWTGPCKPNGLGNCTYTNRKWWYV